MPINGVTGRVRVLRTKKARTGYVTSNATSSFPKDTDVFVAKKADGWSTEDLEAYHARAIDGAKFDKPDEQPFDVGKGLRGMLAFEIDAMDPDDKELSLELLNRSWSHSKLKCSGTGGEDEPGEAVCKDEAYMKVITKATKTTAVEVGEGRWQVKCMGPKCAFWHKNKSSNSLANCHAELRLRFILLHPTVNPEDKNYLKQMGWVEVASGSWNAMTDIQSGFAAIRALTTTPSQPFGRTQLIPFTLRRVPRTMMPEGKRIVKATLLVDFDTDEVLRFGYGPPARALLRPAVRKELLEMATAEAQYDSFKDIVPRPQLEAPRPGEAGGADYPLAGPPTGTGGSKAASGDSTVAVPASPASVTADRDDVVQNAVAAAGPQLTDEELNAFLDKEQRNELKVLTGGTPGDPESLTELRRLMKLAYQHFEETPSDLSRLRVRHARWIVEALQAEKDTAAAIVEAQGQQQDATSPSQGTVAAIQPAAPASPDPGGKPVQGELLG